MKNSQNSAELALKDNNNIQKVCCDLWTEINLCTNNIKNIQ